MTALKKKQTTPTEAPAKFLAEMATIDGVTKPVAEWCKELGMPSLLVYRRRIRAYNWKDAFKSKVGKPKAYQQYGKKIEEQIWPVLR